MSSESSSDNTGSSTSGSSGSTSSSSSTSLESEDILETGSTTSAPCRKKRGATKCKKLDKGGPRRLTFDKNGIPQSPEKHVNQFSSYCGHLARMRVDIRIKDWRKVPKVVKKNLWEDVSSKFIMPKDKKSRLNAKRVALKSMCHAWRDFKWKLNTNYVKNDKTPFQDYPLLKKEWWPGFVEWVTSDEYIALGQKGKISQSMNNFRQKLGRRSYTVQRIRWAKEDAQAVSEGKPVPFQDMPDGRHKDWARARNPSGDAKITESHPIIKKIVDLNAKSIAGTFTPSDNMDILATAIGSNHPGRTTGVSAYVGLGMGLAQGDTPRKKKRTGAKEYAKQMEEHKAKLEKLTAMYESMERRLNGAESCSSSKFVDQPECTTHHPVDSIEEVTKCKLVVHIGPQFVVVARGQAFPPKDVHTVHGLERRDEHTRVQVDYVFDNFIEYPLPIPIKDDDIFTLGDARNSFVLWPKSGIRLGEEITVHANPQQETHASPPLLDLSTKQDKMPTPSMGTNTKDVTPSASNDSKKRKRKKHKDRKEKHRISQQKNTEDVDDLDPLWTPPFHERSPSPVLVNKVFKIGQPFTSSALLKSMGKQSQCFHKWYLAMTTPRPRREGATHFMVRYEEHDFHIMSGVYSVEFADVFHLYNDLALVISLHRSWMLYMRRLDKYRGVVGFLDPEMVVHRRITNEADEVGAYIVKALLAQQDKECIFVVCQEGYHWVLFAIFPKWNTVYTIDSNGYQPPSSYSINKLFDRAFIAYVDQKGQHDMNLGGTVIWKCYQAHIQPSGRMLCGQYVMHHMLSFAENLSLDRNRYPQGKKGFATSPLSPEEIANVRERLLHFFMTEVIDIGGSCRVEGVSYN